MVFLRLALLLLVGNVYSFYRVKKDADDHRCWTSGNGGSAQWWNEGAEIIRGKYFYTCADGSLKPQGCIVNDTFRVKAGETYIDGSYEVQCIITYNDNLQFKFISCVSADGRKFKPDETWEDPERTYWYICKRDREYLRETIGGCVTHDKTKRIKLDEVYDYGNFTYKCSTKSSGTVSMCSVGCIHKGAHYQIGEQWPDGEYIYYCKRSGTRTQKVFIGCYFDGKSLYDGDRFYKGDTIYQCEVRPNSYAHRPVGCFYKEKNGTVIERIVGCRWFQQLGSTKTERTCIVSPDEQQTAIQSLGCIYQRDGFDVLFIYPDSYTIWVAPDSKVVGLACKKNMNGDVYLESFGPEQIGFRTQGLRYDTNHGA